MSDFVKNQLEKALSNTEETLELVAWAEKEGHTGAMTPKQFNKVKKDAIERRAYLKAELAKL